MPEDSQLVQAVDSVKASRRPLQKRKQLERDIEHITEEMYKRNKELADTNKTLSLLRTIDALVLESQSTLKIVCDNITGAITQSTNYSFAGLLTRARNQHELTLYGWSGKDNTGKPVHSDFNQPLHVKLPDAWLEDPKSGHLLSLQGADHATLAKLLNYPEPEVSRFMSLIPLQSLYVVKLTARHRIVGLLVVGFLNPATELAQGDTLFLDRLSETIGVALDNKLLFEENQRVLKKLQETNVKLRALDETKDDFISMASHQLRTPLTSVKGYLSMVLEGDAGEVSPQEKAMLQQAFFSAQRMVYLIADLLNVSRLKTGKFIIEPTKVNLATVVGQEIEQLKETAKSRQLTLSYDQPKNFPEVMLDETKTRQVIMNFVDNAIYYTPAGGQITVKLMDSPATIELRVQDNGIGVPKSEQHHLFTKFYRAGNARKARPDGTGLGLFMAKKVIAAQGGSIVFESQEGKGSTFGFILSKSHLNSLAVSAPLPASVAKEPTTVA